MRPFVGLLLLCSLLIPFGAPATSRIVDPALAVRQKCVLLLNATDITTAEGFARLGERQRAEGSKLSNHHEREQRLRCAVAAYSASTAIDPEDPELHMKIADLYLELGDTKAAALSYHEALRLDAHQKGANLRLAQIAYNAGDVDSADRFLRLELGIDPNSDGVRLERARRTGKNKANLRAD